MFVQSNIHPSLQCYGAEKGVSLVDTTQVKRKARTVITAIFEGNEAQLRNELATETQRSKSQENGFTDPLKARTKLGHVGNQFDITQIIAEGSDAVVYVKIGASTQKQPTMIGLNFAGQVKLAGVLPPTSLK